MLCSLNNFKILVRLAIILRFLLRGLKFLLARSNIKYIKRKLRVFYFNNYIRV